MSTIETVRTLVDALEAANNGLGWYRDMCPQYESKDDAETSEQIEAALAAGRAAIEARASAATQAAPVAWETRWFDSSKFSVTPGWTPWERIKPKGLQTMDDAVQEMRDYIDRGYRYELRALYAAPLPPVALPALTDEWQSVPKEPTEAMVAAYLQANDAYWRRKTQPPDSPHLWRGGSPTEATIEGYRAMLAVVPILAASAAPAPEQMQPNAQGKGHSALSTSSAPCGDEAVTQPSYSVLTDVQIAKIAHNYSTGRAQGDYDFARAIERATLALRDKVGCECVACKVVPHASDCAVHNEPALPIGRCDCGAAARA